MSQPAFYHLEAKGENTSFTCYFNGIPVLINKDQVDATASIPVQSFMIGTGNALKVEATTIEQDKPGTLSITIVPYNNGEYADTGEQKEGIAQLTFEVGNKQIIKEISFDNEEHNFSYIFKDGEELDEAQVFEYAMAIYKLMENRDAEGFMDQMRYKIKDYSLMYGHSEMDMKNGLKQQLLTSFFKTKYPKLVVNRISVKSYCDGRVWELLLDGEEFLKKKEDGGSMQMPVYVAKIDGMLGIVR